MAGEPIYNLPGEEDLVDYGGFTEEELTLYFLSDMLDTLIEQMMWLREMVEQEIERTGKACP